MRSVCLPNARTAAVAKRERAAFELYSDMAEKVPDTNLKQVFVGLAGEEAKHKLFFETEYEEGVLKHN
jgi:rubrerythrin